MKVETLIKKGIVKLEMYGSITEHTNEYGIEAVNPLFIKHLSIEESHRLKGIGNKVIKYLDDYAEKNEHDVIFGHITQKAEFTKDDRETFFCDTDMIKNWLHSKGYAIQTHNNDFHKVMKNDSDEFGDKGYSVKIVESAEHLRSLITDMLGMQEGMKKEKPRPLIQSDVKDVKILVSKATEEEKNKLIKYLLEVIKTYTLENFGDYDFSKELEAYNHLVDSIIYMNKIELIKQKKITTIFNFMQMNQLKYFKEKKPKELTCMNFNNQTWLMDGNKFVDISQDDLIDIL
jgi:hypothetical protein